MAVLNNGGRSNGGGIESDSEDEAAAATAAPTRSWDDAVGAVTTTTTTITGASQDSGFVGSKHSDTEWEIQTEAEKYVRSLGAYIQHANSTLNQWTCACADAGVCVCVCVSWLQSAS